MNDCKKMGYTFSLIFTLIISAIYGQMEHIRYQVPDSLLNDHPFIQLDTSSFLTTGVLWDRAIPHLDFMAYQGFNDGDTAQMVEGFQAYLDLYHATLDTSNLLSYDSVRTIYKNQELGFNALPIMTFNYSYQKLKPDAYSSGLVAIQDSQFVISTPAASPFELKTLLHASTRYEEVPVNDTFNIVIPSSLYFVNTSVGIDTNITLQIDLDNGEGFVNANFDQPLAVFYSGEGGDVKNIQLKLTTGGTGVQYAKMKWKTENPCSNVPAADKAPWPDASMSFDYVVRGFIPNPNPSPLAPPFIYSYTFRNRNGPIDHLLKASIPYNSKAGLGKVYVKYRNGATNQTFSKPIIFVEGLDFGQAFDPFVPLTQFRSGYVPFVNSNKLGSTGWPQMWGCEDDGLFVNAREYFDSLSAEGYDLIMLDFVDGADYMQRNAYLLVELIQRINAHKTGSEPNIVIGASMGGQIVRYALSYMENNNIPHCTRLSVSFDSPWTGAHIPMALQSFLDYQTHQNGSASARETLDNLHRPAPKQLLNYHIWKAKNSFRTITGNKQKVVTYNFNNQLAICTERTVFMQEIANMGNYPRQCRNIAIVNGNNQGAEEYPGGQRFLDHDDHCWGFKIQNDLWAGNTGLSTVAVLNAGKGAKKYTIKVNNMQPIYNAPSSLRDDMTDVRGGIEWELKHNSCGIGNLHLRQANSGFIPAVSALNVGATNWHYRIGRIDEFSPFTSNLTHFDSYIAADNQSEAHVLTTTKNMAYFINEVRRGEDVLQVQTGGVLTKVWNNPFENNQLESININTGGKLYFNADLPNYDGTYGSGKPPIGSLSRTSLGGGCGGPSIINVNSGGEMIIGDDNTPANKAYLFIKSGSEVNVNQNGILDIHGYSKIVVEDGGKLQISNGANVTLKSYSNIVVEEGGELIIDDAASLLVLFSSKIEIQDGATINFQSGEPAITLWNGNSEIIIKGKLVTGPNAKISYTGNGQFVFDQNIPWVGGSLDLDSYYDFDPSSEIDISGTGSSSKVGIEIKRPVYFKDGNGDAPAKVDIKYCDISLHNGAFLYSFSPTVLLHTSFDESVSGQGHDGMRIYGNPGFNKIQHCTFNNGDRGILAHWLGNHNPLKILDCAFTNMNEAMRLESGRFEVLRNTFNSGCNVSTSGLQGFSEFNFNDFNASGIDLHGSNETTVEVYGNSFDNLSSGSSAIIWQLNADLGCNNFTNNHNGIMIDYGTAYLNEEAYNYFYNNTIGIEFGTPDDADQHGLYLGEGYNEFLLGPNTNNKLHILGVFGYAGSFAASLPQSDYTVNTTSGLEEMIAYNNRFELRQIPCTPGFPCPPQGFIYEMPVSMKVQQNGGPQGTTFYGDVHLNLPSNLTSIQSICSNSNPPTGEHPSYSFIDAVQAPQGGGLISGGTTTVQDRILEGIQNLSYQGSANDDPAALDNFQEILTSSITNPDSKTDMFLQHAQDLMLTALENSFYYNFFTYEGGEEGPTHPEVTEVQTIIDNAISSLSLTDSSYYFKRFKYNLDKAMSYRNGGFYTAAVNHLASRSTWTHGVEQINRANYWHCVCEAEAGYFDESISPEEYSLQRQNCELTYAGYNFKNQPHEETNMPQGYAISRTDEGFSASLFPQPVEDVLNIRFSEFLNGNVEISITDRSGRIMKLSQAQQIGAELKIDCSKFASGLYFVKLQYNDRSYTDKFIKL